jgi:hypothetical protein
LFQWQTYLKWRLEGIPQVSWSTIQEHICCDKEVVVDDTKVRREVGFNLMRSHEKATVEESINHMFALDTDSQVVPPPNGVCSNGKKGGRTARIHALLHWLDKEIGEPEGGTHEAHRPGVPSEIVGWSPWVKLS